jgi:protein-S-isoprenylcysteine O-methyltransferase Ste14
MTALDKKALISLLYLLLATAALLFIPAGSLLYWQAWVFLAIFFVAALGMTLYLMQTSQALLQRRIRGGPTAEKSMPQKIIMSIMLFGMVAMIVVSALDHRFGWSQMSVPTVLAGDALIVLGWLAFIAVFRENPFAAATVELADDQKVISTGPYAMVRHPMYTGFFVMFIGMPIALGSWWGLLLLVPVLPGLAWRLLDEESFLVRGLSGYDAYRQQVRYRLIPGIW